MTSEEYLEREERILSRVPEEFRSTLSCIAYERGHAYGYNEVLGHVYELVHDLLPAIEAFETRIRSEKQ